MKTLPCPSCGRLNVVSGLYHRTRAEGEAEPVKVFCGYCGLRFEPLPEEPVAPSTTQTPIPPPGLRKSEP